MMTVAMQPTINGDSSAPEEPNFIISAVVSMEMLFCIGCIGALVNNQVSYRWPWFLEDLNVGGASDWIVVTMRILQSSMMHRGSLGIWTMY